MFFDTHAHFLDERFDEDRDRLIKELPQKGIGAVVECSADLENAIRAAALAGEYHMLYAAVGVHPHSASEWDDNTGKTLRALLNQPKVVAVGEIGLDYHYDFSPRDVQKRVFRAQMALAEEAGYPVVIHSREATEDVMEILRAFPGVKGILHCYSGSVETMEVLVQMGYWIAFGGSLTFHNAKKTVEVAKCVPQERMLIETDSPYMTPVPFRGKRNTPEYVKIVAQKLAEVRGMQIEEVERITTRNAARAFAIEGLE